MQNPATNTRIHDLLNLAEMQGMSIIQRLAQPDSFTASFDAFRNYIDEIDQFYVLVDEVEERLPQFSDERRDKLAHNLVNLRWQVCIVEVNATRVFIVSISSAGRGVPRLGRELLMRRRDRLGEIALYFDRYNEAYALPKLETELFEAVRRMLDRAIGSHLPLPDQLAEAMQQSLATSAEPRLRSTNDIAGIPLRRKPTELRVKVIHGQFYADDTSLQAVAEGCADAKMTMDDLALKLGVTRKQLNQMLNGADAMPRRIHDELRSFLRKL